ncbi:MAG: 1-acyl-sn-glycerol-3-phosphate acyltransferase [Bifidobacteriaceae bacterium]|jgi:1-acyl-sn-glycerol-3-phosphate acyltransferase|nr:1-acyl-sn-glycerol-3-phosphate acyltransferase [Bifidobacteriaceae bacterium]
MCSQPKVPFAYKAIIAILMPPTVTITRHTWQGQENFPTEGGFIVAANHLSNLDFLPLVQMLTRLARPPKVLAKESLFRAPIVGPAMKSMGHVPVYRGTAKAAAALQGAHAALDKGEIILIYPEGTITKDPDYWPMLGRPGAVRLALDTGAPLVPVAQWGAQRLLPRHKKLPHLLPPTRITMTIGQPIDLSDLAARPDTSQAAREGTTRLMATITTMLAALRGGQPPAKPFDQFNPDPPMLGHPADSPGPAGSIDAVQPVKQAAQ